MATKLVSRKVRDLTPTLANEIRKLRAIRNERPVTQKRIRDHLALMRAGNFFMPMWAKVKCKEDGVTYRANGQHTSTLIVWLNEYPEIDDNAKSTCGFRGDDDVPGVPDGLKVSVDEWVADTRSDLATVFAYYDSPVSTRSKTDVLAIHAGEYDEFVGVKGTVIKHLLDGVDFYARHVKKPGDALFGHEGLNIPRADQRASLLVHSGVREWMVWFLDLNDDLRILSEQRAICGWVVYQYETMGPSEAATFFTKIVEEDEDQEGPGYDIMSLVRKQKARNQKSLSGDKVFQRLRKFAALVEA